VRPRRRAVSYGIALGRVGLGTALLVAPDRVGAPWVGRDAGRAGTRVFARGLGARDVLLGLGTLAAVDTPREPLFLAAGVGADLADGLATWADRARLPAAARAVAVLAGVAAAAQAVLAARR